MTKSKKVSKTVQTKPRTRVRKAPPPHVPPETTPTAASSGDGSTAASSGHNSKAASSGHNSKAASSGHVSTAASSGDYSTAASSGDYSTAASSGASGIAATIGNGGRAKAGENGLIVVTYWVEAEKRYRACVGNVGEGGILADVWYKVVNGALVPACPAG